MSTVTELLAALANRLEARDHTNSAKESIVRAVRGFSGDLDIIDRPIVNPEIRGPGIS